MQDIVARIVLILPLAFPTDEDRCSKVVGARIVSKVWYK
jgi:hypothetical protein